MPFRLGLTKIGVHSGASARANNSAGGFPTTIYVISFLILLPAALLAPQSRTILRTPGWNTEAENLNRLERLAFACFLVPHT